MVLKKKSTRFTWEQLHILFLTGEMFEECDTYESGVKRQDMKKGKKEQS